MVNEVSFRNRGQIDPASIQSYRDQGGYVQLEKILKQKIPPKKVTETVKQ
jgi:NADH:ubiquinone oxidoreductase subunit F (NADH-binding)